MIHQSPRAFEGRRIRDQRVRNLPIVVERDAITPAQKLESLAVIAPFATVAAWYVFNATAAVLTGLVFAAACVTLWVVVRRGVR